MSLLAHRSRAAVANCAAPRARRAPLRVVAFVKEEVPPHVQEARKWIADWRTRSKSESSTGTVAQSEKDVPANVQEARQWIANWKSGSQQKSGKASAGGKQGSEQGGVEATPDGALLFPASTLKDVSKDDLLKKLEDKVTKDGSH